jgi:hypothetical protein
VNFIFIHYSVSASICCLKVYTFYQHKHDLEERIRSEDVTN